jgi:hypothetical protein
LLDHDFARLVQHAVVAESIAQIDSHGQFLRAEILLPPPGHGAILFHKPVSFPCALSASIVGSVSHPVGDRPSHPICETVPAQPVDATPDLDELLGPVHTDAFTQY